MTAKPKTNEEALTEALAESVDPDPEMMVTSRLIQKLVQVMNEVGWIEKRGYNDYHKYNYVMESDLLDALREKLAVRGVFILTSVVDVQKEGTLTTVRLEHVFVDAETGETRTVYSAGSGDDKGDKGVYKAITGAMKYFTMKNFLIPTGDDPEADSKRDKEIAQGETKAKSKPKNELKDPVYDEPTDADLLRKQIFAAFKAVYGSDKELIIQRLEEVTEQVLGQKYDSFQKIGEEGLKDLLAAFRDGKVTVTPEEAP